MTTAKERRIIRQQTASAMEKELNTAQQHAMYSLAQFGWELKFIRRKLFQDPIPVVFDGDRKRYAVLMPDGSLNENPGFDIRK